jgi:hypothetical protein
MWVGSGSPVPVSRSLRLINVQHGQAINVAIEGITTPRAHAQQGVKQSVLSVTTKIAKSGYLGT